MPVDAAEEVKERGGEAEEGEGESDKEEKGEVGVAGHFLARMKRWEKFRNKQIKAEEGHFT